MFYIKSELKVDKNYEGFVEICEKFFGKYAD